MRLKVLFVTSSYPSRHSPVRGVFVREHARAVRLFDEVVVLHHVGLDRNIEGLVCLERESDETLTAGIDTYRVRYRPGPIPRSTYLIYLFSMFHALKCIVRAGFRPDVIHAHFHRVSLPAVIVGRVYNLPVTITEHSSAFPRGLLHSRDIREARLAFRLARVVMPVRKALQKGIEQYGIKARFQLVPNVVDLNTFSPGVSPRCEGDPRRLLTVALLDSGHLKGIPYLIQALRLLRQHREDWHFELVGDGPARPEYEALVSRMALADKVTFHGLCSKAMVAEHMRQADIFVLPSLWENSPCVLIEAMASGLPIVATNVGGIPEIVDDDIGLLVPPGDVDSLAMGLRRVLETLGGYDRAAIAERARQYSPEVVGRTLHSVYEECIRT